MGIFSLFKSKKEEPIQRKNSTESTKVMAAPPLDEKIPDVHLTALQKNFLKYMDFKDGENPYIADYWNSEYNLNTEQMISLFLQSEILAISDAVYNLRFLSSKDLKSILKKYHLSQSGNKKELMQRIQDNLSEQELASFSRLKPIYYLTETGRKLVEDLPVSATKDPDFEDRCIHCILRQDYQSAYQLVCEREIHKHIPRNLGLDWAQELKNGLHSDVVYKISYFFLSPLPLEVQDCIAEQEQEIKACVIFGYLFYLTGTQTAAIVARRTGLDMKNMHLPVLCQKLAGYLS